MENNSKKVFLIGGTGRTGKHLITKLLDKGYQVTAMTRNLEKSPKIDNSNFTWVESDILDTESYSLHLKDKSSVISALGMRKNSPSDLYSKGYTQLLQEMEKNDIKRFIAVTADGDHPKHAWFFRYFVRPLFIKKPLADMEKFEKFLREEYKGPVEYTIVRPFRLMEGELGKYRVGGYKELVNPGWTWKSYTGDVAQFCLDSLEANSHLNSLMSIGE
jgi:putative NADH-flavin reductase